MPSSPLSLCLSALCLSSLRLLDLESTQDKQGRGRPAVLRIRLVLHLTRRGLIGQSTTPARLAPLHTHTCISGGLSAGMHQHLMCVPRKGTCRELASQPREGSRLSSLLHFPG